MWRVSGALLHALMCLVPRAPGDERTSLWWRCCAKDHRQPSPGSRDELCQQQQRYLSTLCAKRWPCQFGDASLLDPPMPIVQDNKREPYNSTRVCMCLGFTRMRNLVTGNLSRFLLCLDTRTIQSLRLHWGEILSVSLMQVPFVWEVFVKFRYDILIRYYFAFRNPLL